MSSPDVADRSFGGSLSNGGEVLTVLDATGGVIQTFAYDDNWYKETDGDGFSLVATGTTADAGAVSNWRSSALLGGSPAVADPVPAPADYNGSGTTDRADVVQLLRQFGRTTGSHRFRGDFNLDGATSLIDLAATQVSLGSVAALTIPSASASAVVVDAAFASQADDHLVRRTAIRRTSVHTGNLRRIESSAVDRFVSRLDTNHQPSAVGRLSLRARRHRLTEIVSIIGEGT